MSSEGIKRVIADVTELLQHAYNSADSFIKVAMRAYEHLAMMASTLPADLIDSADHSIGLTINLLQKVRTLIDKRIEELEVLREKLKEKPVK